MIFEYPHFKVNLSRRVESELHQAIQEAEKDLIKVLDINTFHTSLPDILTKTMNLWFLTTALHIRINMFTYANIWALEFYSWLMNYVIFPKCVATEN